jgi:hypothetical protein
LLLSLRVVVRYSIGRLGGRLGISRRLNPSTSVSCGVGS